MWGRRGKGWVGSLRVEVGRRGLGGAAERDDSCEGSQRDQHRLSRPEERDEEREGWEEVQPASPSTAPQAADRAQGWAGSALAVSLDRHQSLRLICANHVSLAVAPIAHDRKGLPPAQLANDVDELVLVVLLRRLDPHAPVHPDRHLEREPRSELRQERILGREEPARSPGVRQSATQARQSGEVRRGPGRTRDTSPARPRG